MRFLWRSQCWVTVRGGSLRSWALMVYLCRGQSWVTVRGARFAQKHLTGNCAAVSVESQ